MAPTLQLVYPLTMPRAYGKSINFQELIDSEPLFGYLAMMTSKREEFITQLNTSEISTPNLMNIYAAGEEYITYLISLAENCTSMAAEIPFFSWRSGVNSQKPAAEPKDIESLKQALTFEMHLVLCTMAASQTALASFLIEFDNNATAAPADLAKASHALSTAAGIYDYCANHLTARIADICPKDRSQLPELQSNVIFGLKSYSCLCLNMVAYESARGSATDSLMAKICKQILDDIVVVRNNIPSHFGFDGVLTHLIPVQHLYSLMMNAHLARVEWKKENWGLGVGYGRQALKHLADLKKFDATMKSPVIAMLITRETAEVEAELAAYENDNSHVYFDRVHAADTLPKTVGITVKGPTALSLGCQPDFVATLVQLTKSAGDFTGRELSVTFLGS